MAYEDRDGDAQQRLLMQELGKHIWSYNHGRYTRLSTLPDIIVPTFSETERHSDDERWANDIDCRLVAEKRPLIGGVRDDDDDRSYDNDDATFESAPSRTLTRLVRRMRMIACVIVTITLTTLLLAVIALTAGRWFYVLASSRSTPTLALAIDKDVLRSPCCSPTYAYVPHNDEGVPAVQSHAPLLEKLDVLDAWIAFGRIPTAVDLSAYQRIDAVTLWVNGSDPRHQTNRALYGHDVQRINHGAGAAKRMTVAKASVGPSQAQIDEALANRLQNTDNRFRDLNELRYSVRSTRLRLYHFLGTHHILSTDFWRTNATPPAGVYDVPLATADRRGQAPQWLDPTSPLVAFGDAQRDTAVAVRLHHDWQTFIPFHRRQAAQGTIERWRAARLPTFSSMAAEAVVGLNMPGLAETFLLSSDDMFLTSNLTTADFYTPMFGPVLHIDFTLYFAGNIHAAPGGEGTSMEHSVALLRDRFGTPGMGYPAHIQKVMLQPLVVESRMMWRDAFDETNAHRFRADGRVANSHMLTYGMLIERHREALLWSFLVARCDLDGDGVLDDIEMLQMLREMGVTDPNVDDDLTAHIHVNLTKRTTNSVQFRKDTLRAVQYTEPLATTHTFSSFDGYPFAGPSLAYTAKTGLRLTQMPPRLAADGAQGSRKYEKQFETPFCTINLRTCWPRNAQNQPLRTTHDVFVRFAFAERGCGDCLIIHLVGQSGSKGLQAFLPPADLEFGRRSFSSSSSSSSSAYHLPIASHYLRGNFSLAAVAKDNHLDIVDLDTTAATTAVTRRTFVLHLLLRYTYSLGTAPGGFEMLRAPHMVEYQLKRLARQTKDFAFLCINDDLSGNDTHVRPARDALQHYFETIWPSNATRWPFERRQA